MIKAQTLETTCAVWVALKEACTVHCIAENIKDYYQQQMASHRPLTNEQMTESSHIAQSSGLHASEMCH